MSKNKELLENIKKDNTMAKAKLEHMGSIRHCISPRTKEAFDRRVKELEEIVAGQEVTILELEFEVEYEQST